MAQQIYNCPKCNGLMIKGFIVERSETAYNFPLWIEGEPEQRRVLGLSLADVEIDGRRQYKVRATRCEQCGFLELYAV